MRQRRHARAPRPAGARPARRPVPAVTKQMTVEDLVAQLSGLTGLTAAEWRDFLAMSPEAQAAALLLYQDADWVRSKDTLQQVLDILGVIGTLAGVVSGVAGAAGAVAALRSL